MLRFKHLLLLGITIILTIVFFIVTPIKKDSILILKVTDHSAVDMTAKGITDYFESKKRKINFSIRSAQSKIGLANQLAIEALSINPKAVIAIGTMPAQVLLKNSSELDTKVIFSSVTNHQLLQRDQQLIGVSNMVSIRSQLKMFKVVLPNMKNLGIIYNPSEANSVFLVDQIKIYAKEFEIKIIAMPAIQSHELYQVAVQLASKIDAIFITNDNLALSGISSIVKACDKFHKPVFCSDIDTISQGVTLAYGPNQYQIGIQTGKLLESVLNDKKIMEYVQFPDKVELHINSSKQDYLTYIPQDAILFSI